MNEAVGNLDFMELGQAIQKAREKQRITREELAEELGISARHLQSVEKEGQYPSFRLFIQLVTMFHISVDQYIHPDSPIGKTTLRRRLDVLLDTFDDAELTIIAGTAQGICTAKEQPED
ncbi:helix-turn-helix transcriptional regulator [Lachnospiraceae bacterium KK002]